MKTYIAADISELKNIAEKFLNDFKNHKIFAFYGKMGAGKTTFIKQLCQTLGTTQNITSPTFAIVNEYKTCNSQKIFHFDFYRIESEEEAFDIGFEEYISKNSFCFIEWPERIENLLPEEHIKIKIEETQNGKRLFTIL